jgi:hypothetical protein
VRVASEATSEASRGKKRVSEGGERSEPQEGFGVGANVGSNVGSNVGKGEGEATPSAIGGVICDLEIWFDQKTTPSVIRSPSLQTRNINSPSPPTQPSMQSLPSGTSSQTPPSTPPVQGECSVPLILGTRASPLSSSPTSATGYAEG